MFKSMRLKNFKAYKDSGEVPLAPLTIIVGANNSGKSTLLHGLLALAQTAQSANYADFITAKAPPLLVTKGPLVDLNGFYDILHGKGQRDQPFFEISVSLETPYRIEMPREVGNIGTLDIPGRADICFGLSRKGHAIEVERSTLWLGDKKYLSAESRSGRWESDIFASTVPKDARIEFKGLLPCLAVAPIQGRPPQEYVEAYLRATSWMANLDKIRQIGPLRLRVPWYASAGARTPSEFGIGGENLLAALGNEESISGNKTLLQLVSDWIAKRKILKNLHVETDKPAAGRKLVGDEWNGASNINVAGMGEGISQILPIIARALVSAVSECLLVEQPEIHLHPALQAELADLFIQVAQSGRDPGRRQLLVETHSEHLLLRVRRRIAEGKLKPEQVSILFVEKINGESKVRRLDLNSRGHFSDWPKGFFDEAYQEAMALAEAGSRKG